MSYMDVKTAADRWELTERRITTLCRDGRIAGAKKEGGLWLIPDDAEKPADGRRNKSSRAMKTTAKLPLPIGVSDFKELVSGYYYVDKTLMLKEFIDSKPKVSLFTRPRRFGKTLAMDMLKTFFEVSDTDTSKYFKNKKIWSCGEEYRREQGKYPVIFVTFKDIKFATWEQTYTAIREIIANEYLRHDVLLTSDKCNDFEKDYFRKVVDGTITEVSMASYVSLIINELISNSLEHGLDGRNGQIHLTATDINGSIELAFSDNGKGLPSNFSFTSNKRLGLTIINNLVTHELKGSLSIENTSTGVLVTIHMKKEA